MPANLSAPPASSNFTAQAEPEDQSPQTSTKAAPVDRASKPRSARLQFLLTVPKQVRRGLCAYLVSDKFQSSIQFALGEFSSFLFFLMASIGIWDLGILEKAGYVAPGSCRKAKAQCSMLLLLTIHFVTSKSACI